MDEPLIAALDRIAEALERLAPAAAAPASFDAARLFRHDPASGGLRRRAGLSPCRSICWSGVERQKARFVENLQPLRGRPASQPRPALGRARHGQELAGQGRLHGRLRGHAGAAAGRGRPRRRRRPAGAVRPPARPRRAVRGAVRRPVLRGGRGGGQGAEVGAGRRRRRAAGQRAVRRHLQPPPPDAARPRREPGRCSPRPRTPRRRSASPTASACGSASRRWTRTTYLAAVRAYAERFDLGTPDLERRALQWSQLRGARSGRVAWQFIRDLAGELGKPLPS